jgi:hypothetical protein
VVSKQLWKEKFVVYIFKHYYVSANYGVEEELVTKAAASKNLYLNLDLDSQSSVISIYRNYGYN